MGLPAQGDALVLKVHHVGPIRAPRVRKGLTCPTFTTGVSPSEVNGTLSWGGRGPRASAGQQPSAIVGTTRSGHSGHGRAGRVSPSHKCWRARRRGPCVSSQGSGCGARWVAWCPILPRKGHMGVSVSGRVWVLVLGRLEEPECLGRRGDTAGRPWPFWHLSLGGSDFLRGANHDLGHEVDDGAGRLLRVVLCKEVAYVVRGTALLPGHKTKDPGL